MVIHLDQIRDEGYLVDQPVSREQLDAMLQADGHDTGFRALGPAPLDVVLRKLNDGAVLVKGTMEAPVRAPCKRCLADVDLTLPISFTLNLVPKAKFAPPTVEDEAAADRRDRREEGESAGSFAIDEADQDVFEGKKIDLDPLLAGAAAPGAADERGVPRRLQGALWPVRAEPERRAVWMRRPAGGSSAGAAEEHQAELTDQR